MLPGSRVLGGGFARAVKLGVGLAGLGEESGGEQVDRLRFRKAGAGEEFQSGAKAGRTHLGGV